MQAVYAVVLFCLALQVWNSEANVANIGNDVPAYRLAYRRANALAAVRKVHVEAVGAAQPSDDSRSGVGVAPVRDDDDRTATIPMPATSSYPDQATDELVPVSE